MISSEEARQFALSLPEAEERDHWGRPSFRVKNKIYMTVWVKESQAVLKLPLLDQSALTQSQPDTFSLAGWEHQGWTRVELDRIDPLLFRQLVLAAWRNVAPKRLVAAFDKRAGNQ